ncbi:MAG: hypothetical protein GXO44_04675 [Deferribacteres bacterium]|nr:hypothetical protein [Deferribacteres bacterium]
MIGTIQRNIKKLSFVLWLIVAAFVGTIFLVWGRGAFTGGANYLAKVGDVEILPQDYQRAYMKMVDFYRNMMKGQFSNELLKAMHVKEQVLNMLINKALILYAAKREGLVVSPMEVAQAIQSIDAFKVGGVFNKDRYVRVLKLNGYSPVEFERELYQDIMRKKLEATIKLSVVVDDFEAAKYAKWLLEKGKIDYFTANVLDFAGMVDVNDKKLKEFYLKHRELFRTQPKISFLYVKVNPSQFIKNVMVTDEDVKEYYRENQDLFVDKKGNLEPLSAVKKEVIQKVREEKARKEALRAIKRFRNAVVKGEDFVSAAKKFGFSVEEVPLTEKDKLKQLPAPVVDRIFALKANDVSDVIKSGSDFYLVKVKEKVESRIPPFEEIRWKVEQAYREANAADAAKRWAEDFVKKAKEAGGLEKACKAMGLKYQVKTSDYFTRRGVKIGDETYRALAMEALSRKVGDVGFVVENGKLVVFSLKEKKEPSKEELAKAVKELKPRLLVRKRDEVWTQFLTDLKERVEIKINKRLWESMG